MSFSKEAVGGFLTHANVGSSSLLERMGDHCLFSLRTFFGGRKYVVLSKYTASDKPRQLQRISFENEDTSFKFSSLNIIKAIVWVILIPLGIILKAASFLTSSSTREDYRSWSKPQLEPIVFEHIIKNKDNKAFSIMEREKMAEEFKGLNQIYQRTLPPSYTDCMGHRTLAIRDLSFFSELANHIKTPSVSDEEIKNLLQAAHEMIAACYEIGSRTAIMAGAKDWNVGRPFYARLLEITDFDHNRLPEKNYNDFMNGIKRRTAEIIDVFKDVTLTR